MAYDAVNYHEVDPQAPSMHFLRDPLDAENLGVTVLDAEGGWTGKEHDHGDGHHEEVYLLVEGAATLTVAGEDLEMEAGDAIRVDPGASRQIHVEEDATMVIAGAP